MLIDWNGDVFLCPQDWQRRQTMGNIMQNEIFDIWNGPVLSKYRRRLLSGNRNLKSDATNVTLMEWFTEKDTFDAWEEKFNK